MVEQVEDLEQPVDGRPAHERESLLEPHIDAVNRVADNGIAASRRHQQSPASPRADGRIPECGVVRIADAARIERIPPYLLP